MPSIDVVEMLGEVAEAVAEVIAETIKALGPEPDRAELVRMVRVILDDPGQSQAVLEAALEQYGADEVQRTITKVTAARLAL